MTIVVEDEVGEERERMAKKSGKTVSFRQETTLTTPEGLQTHR
jgi:hypothetical protein